jgi:predicted N-formylglutamate amidohydrolase
MDELLAPDEGAAVEVRRRAARILTAQLTLHSLTPLYRAVARPWRVGIISTTRRSLADRAVSAPRRDPGLGVGDSQPPHRRVASGIGRLGAKVAG